MMKRLFSSVAGAALLWSAGAQAATIGSGETLSNVAVPGTASIYAVFGHAGDPGGENTGFSETDAILTTFSAGAGNVFSFSATGDVSCCNDSPNIPSDGAGGLTNVTGTNGLSGLAGNEHIPLVGVFTTDSDPFGGSAPQSLSFDATTPNSLSPALGQVFYIGDGKSGYQDASGFTLQFTAPQAATRLYLGVLDAFGFQGETGYYGDNKGAFSADIFLSPSAAPEPSDWTLMITGMGLAGLVVRSRRRVVGAIQ